MRRDSVAFFTSSVINPIMKYCSNLFHEMRSSNGPAINFQAVKIATLLAI